LRLLIPLVQGAIPLPRRAEEASNDNLGAGLERGRARDHTQNGKALVIVWLDVSLVRRDRYPRIRSSKVVRKRVGSGQSYAVA
jgi:hypothetical protein